MFEYTISDSPNAEIYRRQCDALEKHVPGLKKLRELEDADGGRICLYQKDDARIKVINDFAVGGVFVDSEIDLTPFFAK